MLAPGDPDRPVQFSDARDIAAWMVTMLESESSGTFNAVGPGQDVSLYRVLEACRKVALEEVGEKEAQDTSVTWAGESFLRENLLNVIEEERPLWFPEDQIPFEAVDSSRALAAGLRFRPVEETARDTLAWIRSRPRGPELQAGFTPALEDELLRRWHQRPASGG